MKPTDPLPHPTGWSIAAVGGTIEIRRGVSWSKGQECDGARESAVPVLRIGNIQERLDLSDVLHISGVPRRAREEKKAARGWTLLVGSNGNRDRIGNAVFQSKDTEFLFASFLIACKPFEESGITPEFFFRWVTSAPVQARLSATSEGTTGLSNLSHPFFRAMKIGFPGWDEQRGITRILDSVDMAIERTRTAIEKALRLKRALAQDLFASGIGHNSFQSSLLGKIPALWKLMTVGDALLEAQYGLSMPMARKGRYPILRMAAIQDGDVLLDDLKFVDLSDSVAETYLLRRGDVLLNRTNSADLVGKIGVYRKDMPAVFASYLIRLKINPTVADNYFFGQLLASYSSQCRIKRYATPGVQQVNINASNLRRVLIALPVGDDGLREQEQIATILETQDASIRSLRTRLDMLDRLKRGLMQDLLTGRVRVAGEAALGQPLQSRAEAPA